MSDDFVWGQRISSRARNSMRLTCIPIAVTNDCAYHLSIEDSEMSEYLDTILEETSSSIVGGIWADQHVQENQSHEANASVCVCYSRKSTDAQKESSIERQHRGHIAYVKRNCHRLKTGKFHFVDRGKSGWYMEGRDELKALLELARTGAFKILLIEDLDRLSRRLRDVIAIYDELKALGIEIHVTGSAIGRVDDVTAVFYGLFAQEQRIRLLRMTSQAAWCSASIGRNMAGIPYGYKRGDQRGELQIYEEEASVVRRIFKLFDRGLDARSIAFLLNREGIPSPQNGHWTNRTVAGISAEGSGILRNPKYVGVYVYGRKRIMRSHDGKKLFYRIRPKKHWVIVEKPEWTIVERRLWVRVALRMKKASDKHRSFGPREKHSSKSIVLFHGRYFCTCGSRMIGIFNGKSKIRKLYCSGALDHGTCDRKRQTSALWVELEVLREIRDRLLTAEALDLFKEEYLSERLLAIEDYTRQASHLRRKIGEINRWLENSMIAGLNAGFVDEDMIAMREKWSSEKMLHEAELSSLPRADSIREIPPDQITTLKDQINELIIRMPIVATTEHDMLLVQTLRDLVPRIVLHRGSSQADYTLDITSSLGALAEDVDPLSIDAPTRTVRRACPAPTTGVPALREVRERLEDHVRTNRFGLKDADWTVLEPILSDYPRPDKRQLLDATLLHLRTSAGLASLPAPFDGHAFMQRARVMIAAGWFRRAYDALSMIGSPTVAGLDTSRLAHLERNIDRSTAKLASDR